MFRPATILLLTLAVTTNTSLATPVRIPAEAALTTLQSVGDSAVETRDFDSDSSVAPIRRAGTTAQVATALAPVVLSTALSAAPALWTTAKDAWHKFRGKRELELVSSLAARGEFPLLTRSVEPLRRRIPPPVRANSLPARLPVAAPVPKPAVQAPVKASAPSAPWAWGGVTPASAALQLIPTAYGALKDTIKHFKKKDSDKEDSKKNSARDLHEIGSLLIREVSDLVARDIQSGGVSHRVEGRDVEMSPRDIEIIGEHTLRALTDIIAREIVEIEERELAGDTMFQRKISGFDMNELD